MHGQNGRRKAELKILPVVHELGLPFLAITYRNDEGAPPSHDGLLHLGDAEWRDLEAALRHATTMGGRSASSCTAPRWAARSSASSSAGHRSRPWSTASSWTRP
ncbi:hypothetical protein [Nonomuraea salmonea]|uniref:hypothetical protein n=1 Tax=Nonomuraea salmonea TaxID=46181 RepID=UPI0031E8CB3D